MIYQGRYIINAFLICLSLAVFIFFINLLSKTESANKQNSIESLDNKRTKPVNVNEKGKSLFISKCASCHSLFKDLTGPSLFGFEERGPWSDRKNVYAWIRNPSAFMENDPYTQRLFAINKVMMTGFPDLTDEEIDAICDYIRQAEMIKYDLYITER